MPDETGAPVGAGAGQRGWHTPGDQQLVVGYLQQAHDATTSPLIQKLIQFIIEVLSGAPHAKLKAGAQTSGNQGPFDILGHSYIFNEKLTGDLEVDANLQE